MMREGVGGDDDVYIILDGPCVFFMSQRFVEYDETKHHASWSASLITPLSIRVRTWTFCFFFGDQ